MPAMCPRKTRKSEGDQKSTNKKKEEREGNKRKINEGGTQGDGQPENFGKGERGGGWSWGGVGGGGGGKKMKADAMRDAINPQ